MKKLMVCALAFFLVACAATTEQLAKEGNWYQIGYQDGVSGNTQRSHKELSSMGSVNQAEYEQGYLEGVTEYCNPNFAYQIGLSGQYYEGVCEGTAQAQKFRMEWQRGWNDYSQ
ncbi:DUF2799 domain-containing protein [Vibrio japonicus]|uniref:DUF2799 domain-containing protein n=1 Tax=Vibrio japonicus TaxID=1824638 RepID=A0ABY5LH26_9VIBR|nr:DUF2799 domain-containing protein [Vibrio japonicus]UUM30123.1 DUF2799 domain-containing protein [Vibrio japonicus]